MKRLFLLPVLSLLVSMWAMPVQAEEDYGFTICGVTVTDDNYDQLTNLLKWTNLIQNDGTVSFDPATRTLTLDNVHIAWPGANNGGIANIKEGSLLTIRIKGKCIIEALTFGCGYPLIRAAENRICVEGTENDILYLRGSSVRILNYSDHDCYIVFKGLTMDMDCYNEFFINNNNKNGFVKIDHATVIMRQAGREICQKPLVFSDGWGFVYPKNVTWDASKKNYVDGNGNPLKTPYYVGPYGTWAQPSPVTAIIRSLDNPPVYYNLWVCGKQVGEVNESDVLRDGVFSYDAEKNVLTVKGDKTYNGNSIIENKIKGLTVYVAGDATLNNQEFTAIRSEVDMTVTGPGRLTLLSTKDAGLFLSKTATLTLKDANVDASGQWGVCGPFGNSYNAKLDIINSTVVSKSTESDGAVCDFRGGITLTGCQIAVPEGGRVDGARIVDANGTAAKEVTIVVGGYTRADVNRDGTVDSADIVAVIKEMPDGDKKADVNGDTVIDSADIVAVIKAMK